MQLKAHLITKTSWQYYWNKKLYVNFWDIKSYSCSYACHKLYLLSSICVFVEKCNCIKYISKKTFFMTVRSLFNATYISKMYCILPWWGNLILKVKSIFILRFIVSKPYYSSLLLSISLVFTTYYYWKCNLTSSLYK